MALINSDEIESGKTLDADVCIVGAGAAGITLAHELGKNAKLKILLIEGGDFKMSTGVGSSFKPASVDSDCASMTAEYVEESRAKGFGGTTNIWGGWCRPISPAVFGKRPWIKQEGWPFSFDDLKPYYYRAAEICTIDKKCIDQNDKSFELLDEKQKAVFKSDSFDVRCFSVTENPRFALLYGDEITRSKNVSLMCGATLNEVFLDSAKHNVELLKFQTKKKKFSVKARSHVLAMGAIENPRILLSSNKQIPAGVGNSSGMVGKYYMDHPHCRMACYGVNWPKNEMDFFLEFFKLPQTNTKMQGTLVASEKLQKKLGATEFSCSFSNIWPMPTSKLIAQMETLQKVAPPELKDSQYGFLMVRSEQLADEKNRIEISTEMDEFGLPKVKFFYHPGPSDYQSVHQSLIQLAKDLGKKSPFRLDLYDKNIADWKANLDGAHHHMGTTRMGANPKNSVVDGNNKVHGVENLFVAGGSVFPSTGSANPTLSIVALSVRLADKLKKDLG